LTAHAVHEENKQLRWISS